MRILFICQYFAPDITAAAFRMSDFARLLAAAGDEVRVITSYPHKVPVAAVDDSPFQALGIDVLRCRVREVSRTGARAYLRHYLSFVSGSMHRGLEIWREGWRPDVIYVSSPPLFVGISGRFLAVLFRRPMVFEVRDIWPDAAVSAGQLRAGSRAFRWGQRLERYLYRKANHITCVAEPMRDYLARWTKAPVTVVYNGVSIGRLPSGTEARCPSSDGRRVLLYAGNLGHVQQLDLLVRGIAQLSERPELAGWQFHLLGAGAQMENLRALARELNVADRVQFLPAVERDAAARMMHQADLLYLHLMHDDTMARTIPSKLFDYLLSARPILAGLSGEGVKILMSTGANVVFPPGDVEGLKQGLLQSIGRWAELDAAAPRNRELVLQRFTREHAAEVLRTVFRSLVSPGAMSS
jgi:glycosyltransferase involved in cell wall biosynthesis